MKCYLFLKNCVCVVVLKEVLRVGLVVRLHKRMNVKAKYTVKFLFGVAFLVGVVALIYWLLAIYKVSNWLGLAAIGVFLILPLINALFSLPGECIVLYKILTSNNPAELEKLAGDLRERDLL